MRVGGLQAQVPSGSLVVLDIAPFSSQRQPAFYFKAVLSLTNLLFWREDGSLLLYYTQTDSTHLISLAALQLLINCSFLAWALPTAVLRSSV